MGVTKRLRAGIAGGLGLLAFALLWSSGAPGHRRPSAPPRRFRSHAPRDRPFDAALREAVQWQQRAIEEAARQEDALKEWDPRAASDGGPGASEAWQHQVARDEHGYLRRASAEAERAGGLARTPREMCRAGALLASLECSLGHHDAELRQARKLVARAPRNELALFCLWHAARCNGQKRLEGQTAAAIAALPGRH
jgi:hypothetical protein